jgi:hypothetical protein
MGMGALARPHALRGASRYKPKHLYDTTRNLKMETQTGIARISHLTAEEADRQAIGSYPRACFRVHCEGDRKSSHYHCLTIKAAIEYCNNAGIDYVIAPGTPS